MANAIRRTLSFSETFVKVEYLEKAENLSISGQTILLNIDDIELNIAGTLLRPMTSSMYSNINIPSASKLILITLNTDVFSCDEFPHVNAIMDKWSHVYDVFPFEHLKDTKLWRSNKERAGNIDFNLWYAPAKTNCGIHSEHNFLELHTQTFGIGRMQKFHNNEPSTVYQEVFMSPGYTHEPFYNAKGEYPWHQYWADTDCIWLAVEF
ncbi:MAG: hypothetical protein GY847_18135 [Proteobacteria bacterium]|nr:hypothetical protein [Pseudomonadota bacterium]